MLDWNVVSFLAGFLLSFLLLAAHTLHFLWAFSYQQKQDFLKYNVYYQITVHNHTLLMKSEHICDLAHNLSISRSDVTSKQVQGHLDIWNNAKHIETLGQQLISIGILGNFQRMSIDIHQY